MRGELKPFVKRLVDYFDGAVTIILFGSRARGDFNRTSDYDLVVISKKLGGTRSRGRALSTS